MMMDRFRSPIRSHLVSVSASRSTPVSVSTPAKASIATSPIRPRTLALPSDNDNVNSLHQFVRSSLLEIFQVKNKNKNGSTTTKQSKQQSNLFPKRVGLCCVYCKNIPKNEQSTHARIFPKNVQGMYRAVCGFQRIHFKNCASVPQEVRDHYEFLKSSDKTRGKTKFWETSAKAIGLRDSVCEEGKAGIVFSSQSSPVWALWWGAGGTCVYIIRWQGFFALYYSLEGKCHLNRVIWRGNKYQHGIQDKATTRYSYNPYKYRSRGHF